jgi:hypothetical protein
MRNAQSSGRIDLLRSLAKTVIPAIFVAAATLAPAAQLSTDARSAIPHDVQQLVVIDYRVMQNSPAAMDLKARVMPPELKQFDQALSRFTIADVVQTKTAPGQAAPPAASDQPGSEIDQYVDQLAFALFRPKGAGKDPGVPDADILGIAQGQFPTQDILANFRRKGVKATLVRANKLYPMGKTGMVACFVDPSTMIFGGSSAVKAALDARDGLASSFLSNAIMMDAMRSVDSEPLWSILDQKGTQTMMRQVLGEAGSIADFESVEKRLQSSWYSMDFQHGVKFDLTLSTGDSFSAATLSSLLNAALVYRKMSGSEAEKQALSATSISSEAGRLTIHFATNDTEFASLLQSPLFQSMVH